MWSGQYVRYSRLKTRDNAVSSRDQGSLDRIPRGRMGCEPSGAYRLRDMRDRNTGEKSRPITFAAYPLPPTMTLGRPFRIAL